MQIENPQGATPDATFHTCYVALTLARARRDNVNFVVDRVRVTASFHRSPELGEFATIQLNGRCGTVVETFIDDRDLPVIDRVAHAMAYKALVDPTKVLEWATTSWTKR